MTIRANFIQKFLTENVDRIKVLKCKQNPAPSPCKCSEGRKVLGSLMGCNLPINICSLRVENRPFVKILLYLFVIQEAHSNNPSYNCQCTFAAFTSYSTEAFLILEVLLFIQRPNYKMNSRHFSFKINCEGSSRHAIWRFVLQYK